MFNDDFSRYTYVYLKTKDETLKAFKEYKAELESQIGKRIELRLDKGSEYNSHVESYYKEHGIIHSIPPYSH